MQESVESGQAGLCQRAAGCGGETVPPEILAGSWKQFHMDKLIPTFRFSHILCNFLQEQ